MAARSLDSARKIADRYHAKALDNASEIDTDTCDYVIIAVCDSSVETVAAAIPAGHAVVLHTSGSIPLESLEKHHEHCAVLYPLQTFSRDVYVDVAEVPVFVEASDQFALEEVKRLASMISGHVYEADSTRRKALHVAGVLTSNFPIYLLQMAQRALAREDFGLEVVEPLMRATIDKAFSVGPEKAMTGPARRGDMGVVEAQAEWLDNDSDRTIYNDISQAIFTKYNEQN